MVAHQQTFAEEPSVARGVLGPAVLAGVALLLVHSIVAASLGAVSATATPGPETAGGVWDVAVWVVALVAAGAAARPVLRRTTRPLAVGAVAGLLAATLHGGIVVGFATGATPALVWRVASLALVGAAVGGLSRPRP